MALFCPYCDVEINEKMLEQEDGCCPECGAIITASNVGVEGEDEYEDEFEDEFDDIDEDDRPRRERMREFDDMDEFSDDEN